MQVRMEVDSSRVEAWLTEWQGRVRARRPVVTREIAGLVLGRVMERNPVDTGRSRAAWGEAGNQVGVSTAAWSPASSQAGDGVGRAEEDGQLTRLEFENRVEYTPFLEYGTSRMAARAMVRGALASSGAEVVSQLAGLFE
ncbi:hypothetical protein [Rubinisphaera sp. JC750]|uniref:hypothetical protein n=1 Tax=Rubinisphaera sp. JC750 TaxID=2898658 RepID=UPI001F1CE982|nr:hypothetical protein [Rubinisphaera sp. JC750]